MVGKLSSGPPPKGAPSSGARPSSRGVNPSEAPSMGVRPPDSDCELRSFFGVGTRNTSLHAGQRAFLPAAEAGVRTTCRHLGQRNCSFLGPELSCRPPASAPSSGRMEVGVAGLGPGFFFEATSGIRATWPHLGHLPFLPAVPSGVRTRLPQVSQWNSMLTAARSMDFRGMFDLVTHRLAVNRSPARPVRGGSVTPKLPCARLRALIHRDQPSAVAGCRSSATKPNPRLSSVSRVGMPVSGSQPMACR